MGVPKYFGDDRFNSGNVLDYIESEKKRVQEYKTDIYPSLNISMEEQRLAELAKAQMNMPYKDYQRYAQQLMMAQSQSQVGMKPYNQQEYEETSKNWKNGVDKAREEQKIINKKQEENDMAEKKSFGFKDAILMVLIGWLASKLINSWSGEALKEFWNLHKDEVRHFFKGN